MTDKFKIRIRLAGSLGDLTEINNEMIDNLKSIPLTDQINLFQAIFDYGDLIIDIHRKLSIMEISKK